MQNITQEQAIATKKFFASPSKLSSGESSRRFKGSIKSNFYVQACTNQSGGKPSFKL